ncbi:unnamed protein product, partial [Didymodactylos carnosus]
ICILKDSLTHLKPKIATNTAVKPVASADERLAKPSSVASLPVASSATMTQQDVLQQRVQSLQKQIDSLRAKTSDNIRRAILTNPSLSFTSIDGGPTTATVNKGDEG